MVLLDKSKEMEYLYKEIMMAMNIPEEFIDYEHVVTILDMLGLDGKKQYGCFQEPKHKLTEEEAAKIVDDFYDKFPKLREFRDRTIGKQQKNSKEPIGVKKEEEDDIRCKAQEFVENYARKANIFEKLEKLDKEKIDLLYQFFLYHNDYLQTIEKFIPLCRTSDLINIILIDTVYKELRDAAAIRELRKRGNKTALEEIPNEEKKEIMNNTIECPLYNEFKEEIKSTLFEFNRYIKQLIKEKPDISFFAEVEYHVTEMGSCVTFNLKNEGYNISEKKYKVAFIFYSINFNTCSDEVNIKNYNIIRNEVEEYNKKIENDYINNKAELNKLKCYMYYVKI